MTASHTLPAFDAAGTALRLPYAALVEAIQIAAVDYAHGRIVSPERLVVPLNNGGVMLSMPATAPDIAIHKLVNVCPGNRARGWPTIHGQVTACDADSGVPLFMLDGPTVTGRRTAAVSMLGIRLLACAEPRDVLVIGTGTQALNHVEAIGELFPAAKVRVRGSSPARAVAFCEAHAARVPGGLVPLVEADVPESVDLVITATTSKTAVYDEAPRASRLVIGVGAFTADAVEIGARTVLRSVRYVDDLAGAAHEAGDYIQAGVDWTSVSSLADAIQSAGAHGASAVRGGQPVMLKTVGCAAWDLAACRVARSLV